MQILIESVTEQDDLAAIGRLLKALASVELQGETQNIMLGINKRGGSTWLATNLGTATRYIGGRGDTVYPEHKCMDCHNWVSESDYIESYKKCQSCCQVVA